MEVDNSIVVKIISFLKTLEDQKYEPSILLAQMEDSTNEILKTVIGSINERSKLEQLLLGIVVRKLEIFNMEVETRLQEFEDPLTGEFMQHPVLCCGKFYERSSITAHFETSTRDPITGEELEENVRVITEAVRCKVNVTNFLEHFFKEASNLVGLAITFLKTLDLSHLQMKEKRKSEIVGDTNALVRETVRVLIHKVFYIDHSYLELREKFFEEFPNVPDSRVYLLATRKVFFKKYIKKKKFERAHDYYREKIEFLVEENDDFEFYLRHITPKVYSIELIRKYVSLFRGDSLKIELESLLKLYPGKVDVVLLYVDKLKNKSLKKVLNNEVLDTLEDPKDREIVLNRCLKHTKDVALIVKALTECSGYGENYNIIKGLAQEVLSVSKSNEKLSRNVGDRAREIANLRKSLKISNESRAAMTKEIKLLRKIVDAHNQHLKKFSTEIKEMRGEIAELKKRDSKKKSIESKNKKKEMYGNPFGPMGEDGNSNSDDEKDYNSDVSFQSSSSRDRTKDKKDIYETPQSREKHWENYTGKYSRSPPKYDDWRNYEKKKENYGNNNLNKKNEKHVENWRSDKKQQLDRRPVRQNFGSAYENPHDSSTSISNIRRGKRYNPNLSGDNYVQMGNNVLFFGIEKLNTTDFSKFLDARIGRNSYGSVQASNNRLCTVTFRTEANARKSLDLDGVQYRGRYLDVMPTRKHKRDIGKFCVVVAGLPIRVRKRFIKDAFIPIVGLIYRIDRTDEFVEIFLSSKAACQKCVKLTDVKGCSIKCRWTSYPN